MNTMILEVEECMYEEYEEREREREGEREE